MPCTFFQIAAQSNQNYLIKGPRGIRKTNLPLILWNRIYNDTELNSAFLPFRFAEEEYSIITLRKEFGRELERLELLCQALVEAGDLREVLKIVEHIE